MFLVSEERIKKLEKILANYPDILSELRIKDQIIKAFKFEKPLTSIELYDKEPERIEKFLEDLEDFFFIGQVPFFAESQESTFSGLIFLSRFRNLFDVAMNYANKHNGLLDEFADLSGILYGYPSEEVARYCSEERLRKFNLLKE